MPVDAMETMCSRSNSDSENVALSISHKCFLTLLNRRLLVIQLAVSVIIVANTIFKYNHQRKDY